MRKIAAFWVLFAVVYAGVLPTRAQRADNATRAKQLSAVADFESTRAITDGSGVVVRWAMVAERTAGYNLYRVDGSSKVHVNSRLIAGSVLRFGEATARGQVYQFFDEDGAAGQRYVVEGIRLDGTRFTSSEIVAVEVSSVEAETSSSSAELRSAAASNNAVFERTDVSLTNEFSSLAPLYTQQPDPVTQRFVGARAGVKIAVNRDGLYRVSAADLQSAGFPINSDSSKWRLFNNGIEQSIIVAPDSSYIEFYGRGVDIPDTDTRIYYLIADTVTGKRVSSRRLRSLPGSPTARNFPVTVSTKERREFNSRLFNGDEENYLGRLFIDLPETFKFNLRGVDFGAITASVKVSYYGLGSQHEVAAKINGRDLPLARWNTQAFTSEVELPADALVAGENTLQFKTTSASSVVQFDKIEVTYRRDFSANNGRLAFASAGSKKIELTGFPSEAVRVFDISFEGDPVLLSGLSRSEASEGYNVQVPSTRAMVGYAIDDSAVMSPLAVTANTPSALATPQHRVDMIIVSPSSPEFEAAAESWATYRTSRDGGALNVEVVDIADIYDEFNYGLSGPKGVKKFVEYASTEWANRPGYLLLLGDGTRDPRNYEGRNETNTLPTMLVTLINEESGSDEALGDFDGDGLSSISIGRIPAKSGAQLTTVLNKTIDYEANQLSFDRGVLFAHDNSPEFEAMTQQLSQRLPNGTPTRTVIAGEVNANENLIGSMREGKLLVNYSGHGNVGRWSSADFFTTPMVPQVTNRRAPSVFTMLTCENGYFLRPGFDSMAEALVLSSAGGAAATWAATSQSESDWQLMMADRFFSVMAEPGQARIGDLIREAKLTIDAGADVRLQWALLGDPALKMP